MQYDDTIFFDLENLVKMLDKINVKWVLSTNKLQEKFQY